MGFLFVLVKTVSWGAYNLILKRSSQPSTENSLKALSDLIVVILFSQYKDEHSENHKGLIFKIEDRKETYLLDYIQIHNLESQVINLNGKWHIKQSVLLEKMIREWTTNGKVTGIDPRSVTNSTFFLWILLFGRKTATSVALDTNLSERIKKDIPHYFNKFFATTLFVKDKAFYIKPYHQVLSKSILSRRPAKENLEYNYLLPNNEVHLFKNNMRKMEEGSC